MKAMIFMDGKEIDIKDLPEEVIIDLAKKDPKIASIVSLMKLKAVMEALKQDNDAPKKEAEPVKDEAKQEEEPETICFGCAILALKQGYRIGRKGWNGKGMYLYLVPENEYPSVTDVAKEEFGDKVPYGAYIAMKTAQGNVVPWTASQTDILSDDWLIVE